MSAKCVKHDFLKQLSKGSYSFDNDMEEVGIESWDDVALLTNFVKAFKG